jgi:hypothetical protein
LATKIEDLKSDEIAEVGHVDDPIKRGGPLSGGWQEFDKQRLPIAVSA